MITRRLSSKINFITWVAVLIFLSFSVFNSQNNCRKAYRVVHVCNRSLESLKSEEIITSNLLVSEQNPLEQLTKKISPVAKTTTTTTTTKPTTRITTAATKKEKPKPKPIPKPEPDSDDFEYQYVCSASFDSKEIYRKVQGNQDPSLPQIFVITPTYERPEMIPELTRLGQSLLLVPRIHWIVAEDIHNCSDSIIDLLNSLGSPYTYLASPVPNRYKKGKYGVRGVSNRRAGLDWIKKHGNDEDVLFFLDDDNTVDVKLFDEIRFTKKVSMFPVGFIGAYRVSSPIVKKGKVVGYYDSWLGGRKFAVDMAGFAVNVGLLREKVGANMPYPAGMQEEGFLKSLGISLDDLEPMAEDCTKILVWHTKTERNHLIKPINLTNHADDNLIGLVEHMKKLAVIK